MTAAENIGTQKRECSSARFERTIHQRQKRRGAFRVKTDRFGIGILALVAVFVLSACGSITAQIMRQDAFIGAIKSMKPSVTPVICVREPQPHIFQTVLVGSAFFVSDKGDFITAAHVADSFSPGAQLAGCPMAIWFRTPTGPATFDAEVFNVIASDCVRDDSLDIARCHTAADLTAVMDGKFKPTPVVIDSDQRDDGTAIAITGFPLGNSTPISSRGYIGGYLFDARGPIQMVIDRAAWPGNSGSPVYDSRGRVVGMLVQAGEGLAGGISSARSGLALSQFMTAHPLSSDKQ
jgi:V8-like Glu-specific endopeptidase